MGGTKERKEKRAAYERKHNKTYNQKPHVIKRRSELRSARRANVCIGNLPQPKPMQKFDMKTYNLVWNLQPEVRERRRLARGSAKGTINFETCDLYIFKCVFFPGMFKVGRSSGMQGRAKGMSESYPWNLIIMKVYEKCGIYECTVHKELDDFMVRDEKPKSEWFRLPKRRPDP